MTCVIADCEDAPNVHARATIESDIEQLVVESRGFETGIVWESRYTLFRTN